MAKNEEDEMTTFTFRLTKGEKGSLKELAWMAGQSMTQLVLESVAARKERIEKAFNKKRQ